MAPRASGTRGVWARVGGRWDGGRVEYVAVVIGAPDPGMDRNGLNKRTRPIPIRRRVMTHGRRIA